MVKKRLKNASEVKTFFTFAPHFEKWITTIDLLINAGD
jgi:hypothetical protein